MNTQLKCGLTISLRDELVEMTIQDDESRIQFITLNISSLEFVKALGRLGHVPCEVTLTQSDRLGKTMFNKNLTFEIPSTVYTDYKNREKLAFELAVKNAPEGWIPDNYFQSQNSFSVKGDKYYATAIIRKWE